MESAEIKNIMESRSIQRRVDFIEDYNFEDDIENRDYYIQFIKNSPKSKNDFYMMLLIDLAELLEIKDNDLLYQYLEYLVQANNYLIKLAVLDYVSYTYTLYEVENIDYSDIKLILQSKYDRVIVKITALLTLCLLFPNEKDKYLHQIKKYLIGSNDYREHIRVYNFFLNRNIEHIISTSYIRELVEISKIKDWGRAVECTILEIEEMLSAWNRKTKN